MFLIALAALIDGPLSKFSDHKVEAEYDSATLSGDVERCLLDLTKPGLPLVYRQPDRPADVTLIWSAKGPFSATATWRVDLHAQASGTHVRSWLPSNWAQGCAPPR